MTCWQKNPGSGRQQPEFNTRVGVAYLFMAQVEFARYIRQGFLVADNNRFVASNNIPSLGRNCIYLGLNDRQRPARKQED